jgi:hypothetical protein
MAAPYHTMNNVSIPQNVFNSSMTGQMGHAPPAPVLQSSSTGAVPPSQMVQSMRSPRAYAQGGPNQQQYSLSNHQVQAQNMQSVHYINPCTQNMVSVHQAAAQQQWPRERYMSTNQQMSASPLASSPRVISGHNTNPRPQAPQQARENVPTVTTWSHFPTTLIPRPGQVIEQSNWPHSHQDRKSLMMSLHQAQARSPDRTRRANEEAERHCNPCQSKILEQKHNCKILPPEATGMRELQEICGSQCVNCYFFQASKPCKLPGSSTITKQTLVPVLVPPFLQPIPIIKHSLDSNSTEFLYPQVASRLHVLFYLSYKA